MVCAKQVLKALSELLAAVQHLDYINARAALSMHELFLTAALYID
jgi:hypothetical protein